MTAPGRRSDTAPPAPAGTAFDDAPDVMSPLEAMMWRAEVDPRLRSPITVVDVLDADPGFERVAAAHEWATRAVPRLRHRVLEPYWGWGTPAWMADPDFALDRHLAHVTLDGPGGLAELLRVAESAAAVPFDRARPPWSAVLVSGLDEGRAGYVLRVHHSLVDGVGLVAILDMLHGTGRDPVADRPELPAPEAASGMRRSRRELTLARVLGRWREIPRVLLGALDTGARVGRRMTSDPVLTATRAVRFVRSAARAALPDQGRASPLLAGRSLERRFLTIDVDLAVLKAAGRSAGGSVNDAFVAAVLGGLRRYHAHFGPVPAAVPTGMPISTRGRADALGGNHWAGTRFAAPLDEPDPARRVVAVRAIVRRLVSERVVDGLGLIAPLLAALPSPLLALVQGGATRGNDLQVSNFPGLDRPAYLAGARIPRSYPLVPLPGGAVMVALMSHEGTCCVGATVDPAAIVDPELFAACLEAGFAEVLDLARA